ncbi:MAG TPA: exopolysaccharide biosynthesis polyprenyl glycosylphosphotransferase [bacterium]|nr:exopolysaccharide biosynthesis polyprenyl glycosylphosphotransferase [bacterium]HPP29698.1 exopolysaccharide biosynthesis polyprenyl glycosylphosphotransferase [bacterium]
MGNRKLLIFIDGVIIFISFLLGYYFRFYSGLFVYKGIPSIHFYLNITLFAVVIYLIVLTSSGAYTERLFPNFIKEFSLLIQSTFWMVIVLTAGTFFYRGFAYSRLAVGFAVLFSFVLLWITHYVFIKMECNTEKRILLIGQGKQIDSLIKRVNLRYPFILTDTLKEFREDIIEEMLAQHKHSLIVAMPEDYSQNLKLTHLAEKARIKLYIIPEIYQFFHSGTMDDIDGLPLIVTGRIPAEKFSNYALKRTLDITVGGIIFLLFCVILPLISLIIIVDSKGSVFFRQERIGYKGKIFRIYKFRTMRNVSEKNTPFTSPDDSRITRTGRILRKYNIDEIPQIFNILDGDMSIVGPRPISTEDRFFIEQDYFNLRLRVKPGLTGWAQIHGLRGGHIEPEERFQYDLYYIENWSIWLDIAIILLSPGAIKNAF